MTEEEQEIEATHFAMCLLMPEDLIAVELFGQPPLDIENDPRIKVMAKKFGVSTQVMIIRLCQLGCFSKGKKS